jgi:hypothetical protein
VTEADEELARFLAPFGAELARLFLAARRFVRAAAPGASELIYDAYNAVSCAYSYTGRLGGAFLHVAAYPRYVNVGFNRGAALPDPEGLLAGSGARIRHVRVESAAALRAPGLARLVRAAVAQGRALAPLHAARPASQVRPTKGAKRRPKRSGAKRRSPR